MTTPKIAVIMVNYGTPELAIDGVESVLNRDHVGCHVELHLLDNGSPDDSAAKFQEAYQARSWEKQVELYLESENHGFGRGNNIVLQALAKRDDPPDYVILLNPDAQLENEALVYLVQNLKDNPKAAFAGAGIAKPDGTDVTAAFRFPSKRAQFAHALSFGPVSRLFARSQVALPAGGQTRSVDWVAGAAVMSPFAHLQNIGFFDPDFFLYYEEVELMHRGNRLGYTCLYVPEARVIHAEGAATGVRSNVTERRAKPAYWYTSWRLYHTKMHGRIGALGFAFFWLLGAVGNLVISVVRRKSPAAPLNFWRDFPKYVLRPLLTGDKGAA